MKDALVDARIAKVLSLQTDSAAMCDALDSISEFFTDNSLEARRNLRYDLESKNMALAKSFIAEHGALLSRITAAEQSAVELERSCHVLATSVSDADKNIQSFMQKATELENRQALYLEQGREIDAFLKKFSLSTEEIDFLREAQIDNAHSAKQFFAALSHLCTAYKDCKNMVSTNNYNAGFELLDVLGRHQDAAFERLFEWVKGKCENIPETSSSEDVDAKLQVAIRYLRNLPAYYSQCQDLVANCRRTQVVQRFILALTQGGSSHHVSAAIDLHAHDAVRYVSDMLAWMHQTVVSELEFLQAVFSPVASSSDYAEEVMGLNVQELLARCVQGLGRPLRMRILQSLERNISISALFSIHDLLMFYEATFSRIIKSENAVHSAVKGSLLECKRCLNSAVNRQIDALVNTPNPYPVDLSVSNVTLHCARQIQDILKVHSTALMPVFDEMESCSVVSILGNIVQPVLQACRLSGSSMESKDLAVFMLNNVAVLKVEFIEFAKRSSAGATLKSLSRLMETESESWQDVLVSGEVTDLFKKCDLDGVITLVKDLSQGEQWITSIKPPRVLTDDAVDAVASKVPGLEPSRLAKSLNSFYAVLFSPLAPDLDRLQDPSLRESIRKRIVEAIVNDYCLVLRYLYVFN